METPDLNDELKKISVDGLKQLGDWIHQAKDFAVEQAPLFAQEYAKWWTVSHLISAVTCFALIIPFWWLATTGAKMVYAREALLKDSGDRGMYTFAGFVVRAGFTTGCFVSFLVGSSNLRDAAKGYFAPRVVIVEGINDIVRGSTANCGGK